MSHSHSANPNLEADDKVASLASHAGVDRTKIELIVYRRLARSLVDRIDLGADVDDLREDVIEDMYSELGADRGLDTLMAAALSDTESDQ